MNANLWTVHITPPVSKNEGPIFADVYMFVDSSPVFVGAKVPGIVIQILVFGWFKSK